MLADPDAKRAERTFKLHEKAPKYTDFRRMLDKENGNIDAVIVATPDFMHGMAFVCGPSSAASTCSVRSR